MTRWFKIFLILLILITPASASTYRVFYNNTTTSTTLEYVPYGVPILNISSISQNYTGDVLITYDHNTTAAAGAGYGIIVRSGVQIANGCFNITASVPYVNVSCKQQLTLTTSDIIQLNGGVFTPGFLAYYKNFSLAYGMAPNLLTPSNGSTQTKTYPPITGDVDFSWNYSSFASQLLISEDSNFNIISVNVTISGNTSSQSLEAGSYWWKVRYYDTVNNDYSDWSNVSNFTLSNVGGATGLGIQGIVYEILGGTDTPIDKATVYIYNTTYSNTAITGTNGYYLFSPLANGTYNMYAVKNGYDTTGVFPVTVNGSITTNDILMKIYISPYVPNFVFEKFIVRDLFDRSYIGVTATVYKGDSLTASFTGTTDSTGSVVFQLIKDQRYRVTFSGGGISGTITIYVYAKEESYYVRVLTGFPTGGDRYTDIITNLTSIQFDATTTNLTLLYNDTLSSTIQVNFYVKNLSTNVICYKTNSSSVTNLSCNVAMSGTYQFGFNATSSVYGFFQEDKIINFDVGKPATPAVDTTVDQDLLQWASIILIVLTAALFSIRTVKYGAVIVPLEALVLWAFGWFEPMANNQTGSFLLLSCAVVIGVMIYLRSSEVKVNF